MRIKVLVPSEAVGAIHDKKDGGKRGLALSDLAILLRASTNVRTYMQALEAAGIPCVVRAGPDLFSPAFFLSSASFAAFSSAAFLSAASLSAAFFFAMRFR